MIELVWDIYPKNIPASFMSMFGTYITPLGRPISVYKSDVECHFHSNGQLTLKNPKSITIYCVDKRNVLEFQVNMAKMTFKVMVYDLHFQYQLRVSHDACLVQIWWFQLKSVTSYLVDNVKFTDRRTDGWTDGQTQATTIPLRPERPRGENDLKKDCADRPNFLEFWAIMTFKVKVNDLHFQYQLGVSHDACLVQIWWFQLKSVTSYRVGKVKFTDRRTDRWTDTDRQYPFGMKGQGIKIIWKIYCVYKLGHTDRRMDGQTNII